MCNFFAILGVAVAAGVVSAVALRFFNVETGFNAGVVGGVSGGVYYFIAARSVGKGKCKTGSGERQDS